MLVNSLRRHISSKLRSKKAQEQAKDPLIQMQQAELQIKAQEVQRKSQKDQTDAALRNEQLKLQKAKAAADAMIKAEET